MENTPENLSFPPESRETKTCRAGLHLRVDVSALRPDTTGRYAKGTGKGTKLYYALIDSTNNGALTVNATVSSGDCAIGGGLGFQIHTFSTVGGNWINNGKLTFTGKVTNARLLVGGFIAASDKAFSGKSNAIYNFGDIECTGEVNKSKGNRIGGIYGQTNRTFANCHVYFTMMASGYSHVGMLTGCERTSSVIGSDCSVGGQLATYNKDNHRRCFQICS